MTAEEKLKLFDQDILWLLEGTPDDHLPRKRTKHGDIVQHDRRGRPLVVTKGVLRKIKQAFLYDFTDEEACNFAGISVRAWYDFKSKHPELLPQIQHWKDDMIYLARQNVRQLVKDGDPETTRFLLKAKRKREFSTQLDVGGPDGGPIPIAAVVFDQEFEKRVKDYEPAPVQPAAALPPPKVRRLAAGLKKPADPGGQAGVHPPDAAA